jgi:hypothetical protein
MRCGTAASRYSGAVPYRKHVKRAVRYAVSYRTAMAVPPQFSALYRTAIPHREIFAVKCPSLIITQSQVIIDHKLVHKKKVLFNVN